MGFADDLAIVDSCPDRLSGALAALKGVCDPLGISILVKKTVFMWLSARPVDAGNVLMGGEPLKEV